MEGKFHILRIILRLYNRWRITVELRSSISDPIIHLSWFDAGYRFLNNDIGLAIVSGIPLNMSIFLIYLLFLLFSLYLIRRILRMIGVGNFANCRKLFILGNFLNSSKIISVWACILWNIT